MTHKTTHHLNTQDIIITTGISEPFLHADVRVLVDGKLVEVSLYKEEYGNGWCIADGANPDSVFPTVEEAVKYAVAYAKTVVLFAKPPTAASATAAAEQEPEKVATVEDAIGEFESAIADLSASRNGTAADRAYSLDTAAQHARDGLSYLPALQAAADKEEKEAEDGDQAEGGK